jgi:hypothetical protein
VPLLSVANPKRPVRSPAAQERDAIALLQAAFRRTRLSAGIDQGALKSLIKGHKSKTRPRNPSRNRLITSLILSHYNIDDIDLHAIDLPDRCLVRRSIPIRISVVL